MITVVKIKVTASRTGIRACYLTFYTFSLDFSKFFFNIPNIPFGQEIGEYSSTIPMLLYFKRLKT
jgi:hypothetical protein